MAEKMKEFKRINFFRGFLTTEHDWNAAEAYHVEKRKLHNRFFHGPGIIPGSFESFRVNARGRGEMAIEITPGYAIDGQGNDILLHEPVIRQINVGDFEKLPAHVYVVVKYIEEPTDYITYKQNPEYKGHRRIAERARIDLQPREPDVMEEIELARILLTPDAKRITEPRDPVNPRQNEIDRRFVPAAGIVGTTLAPTVLHHLHNVVTLARRVFAVLAFDKKVTSAGSVLNAYVTLEMLMRAGLVDRRNFFDYLRSILLLENDVVREVERTSPELSKQREFYNFKDAIRRSLGEFNEASFDSEFLMRLLSNQEKCSNALEPIFEGLGVSADEAFEAEARPTEPVLEQLRVYSLIAPDTAEIKVDKLTLKVVDFIELLDRGAEESHKFKIMEERDKYRTRQRLKYPDGTEVEDAGIAYEGGYCEFEARNLTPHKDLVILMRMDYVHGDWKCDMLANGEKVGVWECPGEDRKFRWRNHAYVVEARHVNDTRLMIRQVPVTADRDINMFKIWFLQPA